MVEGERTATIKSRFYLLLPVEKNYFCYIIYWFPFGRKGDENVFVILIGVLYGDGKRTVTVRSRFGSLLSLVSCGGRGKNSFVSFIGVIWLKGKETTCCFYIV